MKSVTFEFKYNATKVLPDGKEEKEQKKGTVAANQFDNVTDMLSFYETEAVTQNTAHKDEKDYVAVTGESLIVDIFNQAVKAAAIANERQKLSKGPNLGKLVNEAIKSGKLAGEDKAAFNALLAKIGLGTL